MLTVRRPTPAVLAGVAKGALVIGTLDPYGNEGEIAALAKAGVTAVAMEFMPRITRAQVMDILSSQANLAGYQAVIDAAAAFDRALPMMMTAAGTVRPAKVFVMGAGVAGLQAIATAKRLGAVVTRHRRAAGRQGAGRVAGRQVHRGRGRGVQAGRDRRRLRQARCGGLQGRAGGADRHATSPSRTSSSPRR